MKTKNTIKTIILAIVQNPITGRSSGKYSNSIFQKTYDQNILKSKSIVVYNPSTLRQKSNRNKFHLLKSLLDKCTPIFHYSFRGHAKNMSASNYAYKINIKNVFTGNFPFYSFLPANFIFSLGKLQTANFYTISQQHSGTFHFWWETLPFDANASEDDIFWYIMLSEYNTKIICLGNLPQRGNAGINSCDINFDPSLISGRSFFYWGFHKKNNTNKPFNSSNQTLTIISSIW